MIKKKKKKKIDRSFVSSHDDRGGHHKVSSRATVTMAEEEEVRLELEAVQAVYGEDCCVIEDSPPHLNVHIKPRTADDSSQQFVEVIIGIKSDSQYPKKPPHIYVVEAKGLDEKRRTHLVNSIQNKALELSSCLMLVAICEEAVEILSHMNHPDGDCPLCLYPLVAEDISNTSLSFMKLMSCYHCFHSECIIRWWKWVQEQNETNEMNPIEETSDVSTRSHIGMHTGINPHKGNCPVCRMVFDVKDIEHVLGYIGTKSSQLSFAGTNADEEVRAFLQSDSENSRRQRFEALLKLQQENSGLIEPKKDLAILPGMFLPEAAASPPTTDIETSKERCLDGASNSTTPAMNSSSSLNKATTSKHKNSNPRRKAGAHISRRQPNAQSSRKQWTKKEKDTLV